MTTTNHTTWAWIVALLSLAACADDDENTTSVTGTGGRQETISFLDDYTIVFADSAQAAGLLQASDEYTQQLGPFDLRSKTQNAQATRESDYLTHAAQQARSWTPQEVTALRAVIQSAEARIQGLGLSLALPSEVVLVRSTMQEEGGAAGYTRSNFIVLGDQLSEYLFLHELFHVYSRANPTVRDALYATIGFRKTNEIVLPEPLQTLKISNPDAPVHDHVVQVTIDGVPQEAIFLLYSERDYTEGTFFDYLNKRLLLVEGNEGSQRAQVENGQPVLRNYEAATDLRDIIGRNTSYDIDPEEVMADHFTLLTLGTSVPEPDFLEQVKTILQGKK